MHGLLEGKTIMNWNDADTSVSKQFTMSVAEVLEECGHALRILDPSHSPASLSTCGGIPRSA
ncbi:MAG: hypothetical protein NTW21_21660 [Verrucomicrobia bacterium]|nr:hypothetical protein [Verrucomicrobiota bacterium]